MSTLGLRIVAVPVAEAADWRWTSMPSPVGPLLLAGSRGVLQVLGFAQGKMLRGPDPGWQEDPEAFAEERRQLAEYFAGTRQQFELTLAPKATPFQAQVLAALAQIPFGATSTYGDIAKALGNPGASRAVGAANGANPIPVILPCHRVVGSDGSLTGFGGGMDAKKFLLGHEQQYSGLFAPAHQAGAG